MATGESNEDPEAIEERLLVAIDRWQPVDFRMLVEGTNADEGRVFTTLRELERDDFVRAPSPAVYELTTRGRNRVMQVTTSVIPRVDPDTDHRITDEP